MVDRSQQDSRISNREYQQEENDQTFTLGNRHSVPTHQENRFDSAFGSQRDRQVLSSAARQTESYEQDYEPRFPQIPLSSVGSRP